MKGEGRVVSNSKLRIFENSQQHREFRIQSSELRVPPARPRACSGGPTRPQARSASLRQRVRGALAGRAPDRSLRRTEHYFGCGRRPRWAPKGSGLQDRVAALAGPVSSGECIVDTCEHANGVVQVQEGTALQMDNMVDIIAVVELGVEAALAVSGRVTTPDPESDRTSCDDDGTDQDVTLAHEQPPACSWFWVDSASRTTGARKSHAQCIITNAATRRADGGSPSLRRRQDDGRTAAPD